MFVRIDIFNTIRKSWKVAALDKIKPMDRECVILSKEHATYFKWALPLCRFPKVSVLSIHCPFSEI